METNCELISNVKEEDIAAYGKKSLYCDKVAKKVTIRMFLKRPRGIKDKYTGWRVQNVKNCTGLDVCQNKNCEHFKEFRIKEQK